MLTIHCPFSIGSKNAPRLLSQGERQVYETLPRERSISRDLENRRSVSDVDTDLGFLGLRSTDGFKQGEGQGPRPEASRTRSEGSIDALPSASSYRTPVTAVDRVRSEIPRRGNASADDVVLPFNAPPGDELEQWP